MMGREPMGSSVPDCCGRRADGAPARSIVMCGGQGVLQRAWCSHGEAASRWGSSVPDSDGVSLIGGEQMVLQRAWLRVLWAVSQWGSSTPDVGVRSRPPQEAANHTMAQSRNHVGKGNRVTAWAQLRSRGEGFGAPAERSAGGCTRPQRPCDGRSPASMAPPVRGGILASRPTSTGR